MKYSQDPDYVLKGRTGKRRWHSKYEKEPEAVDIFGKPETEVEIDEQDLEQIQKETGKSKEEIFDKALEIESENPSEIIKAFTDEEAEDLY